MAVDKPSIPQGTRDFGPDKMIRRNYIFDTVRAVFVKYGFLPLETPSMEKLSVLTGKYGEEGDQLIFKILNSGDFIQKMKIADLELGYKRFAPTIAEKALRYDLTVPFARYVVMNKNELVMPFKRYQIQPVWRADRPQKGRYREFYQCDADVVGTNSLICELEIIQMIADVFRQLNYSNFLIKINNRKILTAITEVIGMPGAEVDLCVGIDKLDKIGKEKVLEELSSKGFTALAIQLLEPILDFTGTTAEKVIFLKKYLEKSNLGQTGLEELETVFDMVLKSGLNIENVEFDLTLARGLNYYTGAIFEVKAKDVSIGSICGGGRYDNLTGVFGLEGTSGVGISFGIDRIYDVLEELNLFPSFSNVSTKIMFAWFDEANRDFILPLIYQLRAAGINSEIYPDKVKIKKQMDYANKKNIPFVAIIGSDEMETGILTVKDMRNGEQFRLSVNELIELLLSEG